MSKSYHNTQENKDRIFVCEECNVVFADEEIRRFIGNTLWGHPCKMREYKKEHRCEAFLKAYLPEA
jgi:hypothetical protein